MEINNEQLQESINKLKHKYNIQFEEKYEEIEFEKELLKLFIAGIELGKAYQK